MKQEKFGAQLLTLPQIFKDRFFTIPDYQRGYTWDEKQVEELLNDIQHLLDDQEAHRHFTGTLVLSQPSESGDTEYNVVDGQQRLTTLVIFLGLVAWRLDKDNRTLFDNLYLRRGELGSECIVLRLNSDTNTFFERVVMGDGNTANEPATLEAHERLLKARKLIQHWIEKHIKSGVTIDKLCNVLENKLGFLVYAPKEDAETGIMFEVINNRGKPLSELEKVKNYLIYCCVKLAASTLRENINKDWSDILRDLNTAKKTNPADEGAFLRYCMIVHFGLKKTESQYGYDELKKRMSIDSTLNNVSRKKKAIEDMDSFVRFMKTAALWYARLYGQHHQGLNEYLIKILDQIRAQDRHASIMPLFLALVIKQQGQGERLVSLLKLLEILNFRVYMARKITLRNDTGQGDLYYYASSYYHSKLLEDFSDEERKLNRVTTINDDENSLEYRLVEFLLWYAPDIKFQKSFKLEAGDTDDFYKWGGLRYFLMNYEQDLQPNKTIMIDKITLSRSEGKSGDFLSVEHLWAKENRNREGENNRPVDNFEKRRLGNYVLLELRLNIQGSNGNLEDKIPRYLNGYEDEPPTDLHQVRKALKIASNTLKELASKIRTKNYYLELHRQVNDMMEEKYIEFALKRWSVKSSFCYEKLNKIIEAEQLE